MADETALRTWWAARTPEDQQTLRASKDACPLPSEAVTILASTNCPSLLAGARWESSRSGHAFHMPNEVADLIEDVDAHQES